MTPALAPFWTALVTSVGSVIALVVLVGLSER